MRTTTFRQYTSSYCLTIPRALLSSSALVCLKLSKSHLNNLQTSMTWQLKPRSRSFVDFSRSKPIRRIDMQPRSAQLHSVRKSPWYNSYLLLQAGNSNWFLVLRIVDQLWHAIILDTQVYSDLQDALGLTLHHRPSGAKRNDPAQQDQRLAAMEAIYVAFFSDKPLQLKPLLVSKPIKLPVFSKTPLQLTSSIASSPMLYPVSSKTQTSVEYIRIRITTNATGRAYFVRAKSSTKIFQLLQGTCSVNNLSMAGSKLSFNGENLRQDRTVGDYGIVDGDNLNLLHRSGGWDSSALKSFQSKFAFVFPLPSPSPLPFFFLLFSRFIFFFPFFLKQKTPSECVVIFHYAHCNNNNVVVFHYPHCNNNNAFLKLED